MKIEKIIQKILQMPKEMLFKDIVKVLEYEGWEMKRTGATSHFTFKKSGQQR